MIFSFYKCWDIMNCENLDCPARQEPETTCWEIARRLESYHNVSNTCNDCVVYMLKEQSSALSKKELQSIIRQRGLLENVAMGHQQCVLKTKFASH